MRSPIQLNLGGRRSYYRPLHEDRPEILFGITPLREEYEGRPSARGRCPFETDEAKRIFQERILPLQMDDLPVSWRPRLQEAFAEARRLQDWGSQN